MDNNTFEFDYIFFVIVLYITKLYSYIPLNDLKGKKSMNF